VRLGRRQRPGRGGQCPGGQCPGGERSGGERSGGQRSGGSELGCGGTLPVGIRLSGRRQPCHCG
jgi:hypothetical protein